MVSLDDIKLPPHDIDAELGVLCCILLDPDCMMECTLQVDSFYAKQNQIVFKAIKKLDKEKRRIDIVTIADVIPEKDFHYIGGNDYLYEISTAVMTSAVFKEYQKIINEKHIYRTLLASANRIIADCYEENEIPSILHNIKAQVDSIDTKPDHTPFLETLINTIDTLGVKDNTICSYGYEEFDKVFQGYKKGQLIIIGARPSVGKSAIAINLALKVATQGKKAVFFALEMPNEDNAERIISKLTKTPTYSFKYITEEQREDIGEKTIKSIGEDFSLEMYDDIFDFSEICQKIRITKIRDGVDVVFIDYLQLMRTKNSGNKNNDIGDMTTELKRLAAEQGIAIVLCCQLNRQLEMGVGMEPQLHHLRDSGNIEQDANIVIMPYYEDPDIREKILMLVRKNRGGPICQFNMGMNLAHMDMYSLPPVVPKERKKKLEEKEDEAF